MSRSRRKTPIGGMTRAWSESDDKRIWHQRYRSAVRTAIASAQDYEDLHLLVPIIKEKSNPWEMHKDGKLWLDPIEDARYMRK